MTDCCAFSGGIDSTALALLMPEAVPVFTDTGWEFDALYQHIAHFESVTGRKVERLRNAKFDSIPERARHSAFLPNHGARYCTQEFKIDVLNKWLKPRLPATLNIALRADEPDRIGNLTKLEGLTIRYPLREMGIVRSDCVRVCAERDLLPRYPVYMARGGCKGCFYKRKSEVLAMIALVPGVVDELQALEEEVQDERGKFFHMFPNVGMSLAELRSQPVLFDQASVYKDAAEDFDKGPACGAFCHR